MQERIESDLKTALKAGESEKVSVLRMLKGSLMNARIAKKADLDDDEVLAVVKKEAKQRRDSIDSFKSAGRDDLVDKEESELEIIEQYLPEQLSDEALEKIVDDAIESTGATSMADMGQVMAEAMKKVGGQADGARVSAVVRERLSA